MSDSFLKGAFDNQNPTKENAVPADTRTQSGDTAVMKPLADAFDATRADRLAALKEARQVISGEYTADDLIKLAEYLMFGAYDGLLDFDHLPGPQTP